MGWSFRSAARATIAVAGMKRAEDAADGPRVPTRAQQWEHIQEHLKVTAQDAEEDARVEQAFQEGRQAYLEWGKQVVECSKNLALEAHRFRDGHT
mmetsp:Transcript_98576/g.301626  ORF Transcript_98576/g.301626 Transcript_98576/m.301626 type:complete len:95 (+) Transcript_98576:2-286(+)